MTWFMGEFSWEETVRRVKKTGALRNHHDISLAWLDDERQAFRAKTTKTVSQWADEHRVLVQKTSRISGQWRTDLTPYLRDVMDSFNDQLIRHIVFCAGTQLGKSEVLANIDGFIISEDPAPTFVVYPREDDAKMIFRTRLYPMMVACPTIREKIPDEDDLMQALEQHFPGMIQYIAGANSPAGLAIKSARNILRDEVDKFPDSAGKDSDPLSLSEARAKSFWDERKIVDVSSPTVETRGIWRQLQKCDEIKRYYLPCPYCGVEQVLKWEDVKWNDPGKSAGWLDRIAAARSTARYVCPDCKSDISNSDKLAILPKGKWKPDKPSPHAVETVGFWISSLYSPFLTWGEIAAEFMKAKRELDEKGNRKPLQEFICGWLAECWKEKVEVVRESALADRKCSLPQLIAPKDTIALTCGIDVQKDIFYFSVWAWQKNLASNMIHHGMIPNWERLSALIHETTFQTEDGQPLRIWRAGIDTGGTREENKEWSRTAETYHWLRENGMETVFGTKGMSRNSQPGVFIRRSIIDRMPGKQGDAIPGGLELWMLDTDQLKELFFWRLKSGQEEPQPIRFHSNTDDDFFRQLTAEEKQRDKNGRFRWKKVRTDNHYLDTSIIAHACADMQWMGGIPMLSLWAEQNRQEGVVSHDESGNQQGGWLQGGGVGSGQGWIKR